MAWNQRNQLPASRRRQLGAVMVTVLVALGGLLAFSALAIDGSYLWAARTQMQNAADSAALAAGRSLIDTTGPSVTLAASEAAATDYGSRNRATMAAA